MRETVLLSKRVYKEAWGIDEVLAEIQRESAAHFDPELVSAFLRLVPRLGSELRPATSGEEPVSTAQPLLV